VALDGLQAVVNDLAELENAVRSSGHADVLRAVARLRPQRRGLCDCRKPPRPGRELYEHTHHAVVARAIWELLTGAQRSIPAQRNLLKSMRNFLRHGQVVKEPAYADELQHLLRMRPALEWIGDERPQFRLPLSCRCT
jgi:hypothetical protein